MLEADILLLVRGPIFRAALAIFFIGMVVRLFEIGWLGRKPDYAEARGSALAGSFRTIFSRFVPDHGTWQRSPLIILVGYIFHIGFLLVVFLFTPHILAFYDLFKVSWPALPTQIVDAVALLTLISLLILLVHRVRDPVRHFLSKPQDYLVWVVTTLPLITGYLAFHRLGPSPQFLLIMHILSVELLLVVFPFTSLVHIFTSFLARYYTGATAGHRGVKS